MNNAWILFPILFPLLCGALIGAISFTQEKPRDIYVTLVTVINSAFILYLVFSRSTLAFRAIQITPQAAIAFRIDGLSMVYAGLLALLWPLASIYGFEYMRREKKQNAFFAFYTMSYGVAAGVAFSANLITMYLCYELLTLITLPIIMHEMDVKALDAGRKYLMYSVCGAAFAFMGIMILMNAAGTTDFVYGGVLQGVNTAGRENLLRAAYVVTFFGFGVKAAVWPFHGWLPTAGVAPTPVTALLHAVAVVKAGVFAIMRVTYYGFGPDILMGSWAQYVVFSFACWTVVFGSIMAVREQHLKRRLAYSTISNLSYILIGVTLMTPEGLTGGLAHMLFHGVMKIVLFFGAGAVICHAGKEYIFQMRGYAKKMPVTFGCFIVSSAALMGLPGLCGFVSKWYLAKAAVDSSLSIAPLGVIALIISAILTAVYQFTVIVPAYVPGKNFNEASLENVHEAGKCMTVPMVVLCCLMVLSGLFSGPLVSFFTQVGSGLI